jgi:hypothetical protein
MSGTSPALLIEGIGLRWIGPEPQHDLCAHGGIVVSADGVPFIADREADHAVSTGALHLLRAVFANHTPDAPLAEHLIPHCGHSMVLDPATGDLVNCGCPHGVNWWVRHDGNAIVLTREDGVEARTTPAAWARAVARFADQVAAFYEASPSREPYDEHASEWFNTLWKEWDRLRVMIEAGA